MATWAKCPDLFLYTKRKDVYLWRCNETTWMPMKTADFDDLGKVTDHQDLIGGKDSILEWEEGSYNDLVAYISSRRLLVNCRGLVIAELQEFDQDGKMEENGLPFYIRSLDVLPLKPFGLKNRTIPSRMVLYLETEGEAAPVEDSNTTTTTTNMEKQVAELKAANKTLKSDKETAERNAEKAQQERDAAKRDKEAAERNAEKAKQERDAAKQERDAAKRDKEAAERNAEKAKQERDAAKQERDAAKRDKETAERKAEKAQQERDAAMRDKERAERKAASLQTQVNYLTIHGKNPVWMNEFSDQDGNWKTFEGLSKEIYRITVSYPGDYHRSLYFKDDDTTNVRPSYMYIGYPKDANNEVVYAPDAAEASPDFFGYKVVNLSELKQNKERARFNFLQWYRGTSKGDMLAIKEFRFNGCPKPPLDSAKLSAEEVKSLNLLGKGKLGC